jgi:hypothetical protein
MLNSEQRPKITVEDLLRLKRSERPAPEFWSTFECELRQKQLTALLEKRPWWQDIPQLLARRAYLPIGATAVLAFTLVTVKFYAPTQLVQLETPASDDSAITVNRADRAPVAAVEATPSVNRREVANTISEGRAGNVAMVAEALAQANVDVSASTVNAPVASPDSPSSRYIATNLDRLEKTDPELVQAVMGSRLSAPARLQTASLPLNEFASVPNNLARRSRILAQYSDRQLNPEPSAPELVRERLSRRLGDNEITDRISRIGLKGDQVSLGLTLRL